MHWAVHRRCGFWDFSASTTRQQHCCLLTLWLSGSACRWNSTRKN